MGSGSSTPLLCRTDEWRCHRRKGKRNDAKFGKAEKDDKPGVNDKAAPHNSSIFSNAAMPAPPDYQQLPKTFHEALVRERDKKHDFDEIYQVLNEIGSGGLCKIYRVQKYDNKIGGSSRPEGVRRNKYNSIMGLRRNTSSFVQQRPLTPLSENHRRLRRPRSPPFKNQITGTPPTAPAKDSAKPSSSSDSDSGNGDDTLRQSISAPLLVPSHKSSDGSSESSHTPGIPRPEPLSGRSQTEPASIGSNGSGGPHMYFALKVINLAMVKEDRIGQLKNEVEILKTLDHKNIIKAYETFQMRKSKKLMIVMELCTGGDMHARMPYTERQVANAMRQVLSAISYMHSKRIIHRDLKLENILWESKHPEAVIKVIDFGLSKVFSPHNNVLTERVGTLYSMSPETMKGIYTTQADLWSIGVCTFTMLSMNKPFEGPTPKQLVAAVLQCNYDFASSGNTGVEDVWTTISDHAKSFISQLLVVEPMDRLTADTAKNHDWFDYCLQRPSFHGVVSSNCIEAPGGAAAPFVDTTNTTALAVNNGRGVVVDQNVGAPLDPDLDDFNDYPPSTTEAFKNKVRASIVQYAKMGEFRRLALNVIAKKSTSSEIFELRKVFDEFDTLNSGTITLEEFKVALSHFDYSEREIKKIFRKIDVNRNNVINYTEFLAATLEAQGAIEEYRLAEAFDVFDYDDSGYISRDNLKKLLGSRAVDGKYIDRLIAEANLSKDGHISYDEFLQIFNQSQHDTIQAMYTDSTFWEEENAADEVLQRHGLNSPQLDNHSRRSFSSSMVLESNDTDSYQIKSPLSATHRNEIAALSGEELASPEHDVDDSANNDEVIPLHVAATTPTFAKSKPRQQDSLSCERSTEVREAIAAVGAMLKTRDGENQQTTQQPRIDPDCEDDSTGPVDDSFPCFLTIPTIEASSRDVLLSTIEVPRKDGQLLSGSENVVVTSVTASTGKSSNVTNLSS